MEYYGHFYYYFLSVISYYHILCCNSYSRLMVLFCRWKFRPKLMQTNSNSQFNIAYEKNIN